MSASRNEVMLNPAFVSVDLLDQLHRLDVGAASHGLFDTRFSPEKILAGYEGLDESFDAWIRVQRYRWEDSFVRFLRQKIIAADLTEAESAAKTLVAIDPTHEEAHRYLIRLYADSGKTTAALRQYQRLWDTLDDEYDMEPDDETQDLIVSIKSRTFFHVSQRPF